MIPPWVVGLALLALVALLSWAVGWGMGRESAACRKQWEPPCWHEAAMAQAVLPRKCVRCGEVLR